MKASKGVTLIALVITIIVLLILTGISIASLTGQNGLLNKANTSKEKNRKAEYEEVLKLIGTGIRPEKVLENLAAKEFMDRYEIGIQEEIKKEATLKEATFRRKSDESIVVITKEGFVFLITENNVKCLGKQQSQNPPDLKEKDVEFIILPEDEWTNSNVSVEIKSKIEGYILEYSTDGTTWETYTIPVIMKENGTIYVRLSNGLGQEGDSSTKEISKIDKKEPTGSVQVTSSKTSSIEVEVKAQDVAKTETNGCSGIKGYYYSCDGGKTYTEEITTEASHVFGQLESGTNYNIAVKVVDNAGNETQLTVSAKTSEPIYIVKDGKLMMNVGIGNSGYDAGSWHVPGGDFTYCHLKYYAVVYCCFYWAVDVPSADSEIHFSVDSPYEEHGYTNCELGGFLFAVNSLPVNGQSFVGNTKRIKSTNGHFTGAKEYTVKATKSGRIYIGLAGDKGGSSAVPHHVIFRIYNAWIE